MEFIKASIERQPKKRLKTRFFLILILSVIYFGRVAWSTGEEKCYTKILDKSDYAGSLIPYWEIEVE